jgi:hypothetical protein
MEKIDTTAVIGFIILALLPTLETMRGVYHMKKYEKYDGHTTAKVTNIREHRYYHRYRGMVANYYTTYQYNINGVIYESETPGGNYEIKHALWSEVQIRYDKRHPDRFMAEDDGEDWRILAMRSAMIAGWFWLFIICGLIYEVFFR